MKKYKKIFSLIILCFIALCTFSSCEKSGTELADLMIIQGIGVDYKNGEYNVTVEILNNEQSGSPGGDSTSENKTKVYSAKGKSVAEGLRLLTTKSGNLPLFAHNRVIIIGESLQKQKLSETLAFFVRNYDSRASQIICVAKGKTAERLIRAKLLNDTVKTEILENLLIESYKQALIPQVRVIDAINSLSNKNMSLCVPAVTLTKNGENEDYALSGCAVFGSDEGITMFLDSYEVEGLCFLNNDVKNGFFTENTDTGEAMTFLINKCKTKYKVTAENGKLNYHMLINVSCDLDEIGDIERSKPQKQVARDMEKVIEKAVSHRVETALNALKSQNGGDCVRYCKILELSNPKLYETVENNWSDVFRATTTTITVNVTIRRIGEETLKVS